MKPAICILLTLLIPVIGIYAQSSSTDTEFKQKGSSDRTFDQLFNQIVQTIPEKSANLHDSVNQQRRPQNYRPETAVMPEKMKERRDLMTREMPDDLRKQVERAIEEIDLKKFENVPSFIEQRPSNK